MRFRALTTTTAETFKSRVRSSTESRKKYAEKMAKLGWRMCVNDDGVHGDVTIGWTRDPPNIQAKNAPGIRITKKGQGYLREIVEDDDGIEPQQVRPNDHHGGLGLMQYPK